MGDIIGSIFVLLGCVYYMSMNSSYPKQAQQFPRVIIIVTGILAAMWLIGSVRKHLSSKANPPKQGDKAPAELQKTIILIFVELLLYVILADKIGYFSSTFLYLIVTMYTLGYKNKIAMLALSAAIVAVIGLVFGKILVIPLPSGLLF